MSGKYSLADLRSYQDWYLSYYLRSVPGVAEVASAGGFVRQYQVNVDPNRLRAFGLPIQRVVDALRSGNRDVGGGVIESGGAEYMVRAVWAPPNRLRTCRRFSSAPPKTVRPDSHPGYCARRHRLRPAERRD